jgi:hypothetical protein
MDAIHKTMKTKVAFLTFLAAATVSCAWAQSTEDDDMYFTSKDRVALNVAQSASRQEILASTNSRRITESEVASTINPTDSYSARNVNPEYISGSKVGSNTTADVQYFSPNYQPIAVNQNLASNSRNCNCNNNYGYNGFNNGYGYNSFGSFGSPYGMGGMSPYGYNSFGMMNPYSNYGGYGYSPYSMMGGGFYNSALSFGFGSGFGNGFGYGSPFGFGNSYGMNSFYGNGYNSFYNPYSYGYNSSGYGYNNSRTVVAVADRPRPQSARNQEVDRYYSTNGNRGGVANSGGRVASVDNSQQYYNRTWRNDAAVERGTTTWNNTRSYQQNYNNGWNNTNNNNNWGNSNGGFSGGRSSSFNSGGGSSAPSGGTSGGGGSRRGRD